MLWSLKLLRLLYPLSMVNLFNNLTFPYFSSMHVMNHSHFKVNGSTAGVILSVIYLSFSGLRIYTSAVEGYSFFLTDHIERGFLTSTPNVDPVRKTSTGGITDVAWCAMSISAGVREIIT